MNLDKPTASNPANTIDWIACHTLFRKEVARFIKVWLQTILAPVVTSLLYLVVFGHVLEGRIEVFPGVSYVEFLIPGLLMMSVIQNAFANTSSSMIQSKVMGNIIFILLPPFSALEMFLAYIAAAVVRGLAVGVGVFLLAILYVQVPLENIFVVLIFAVLGSYSMGALGLIAGMWAEKFDQIAAFQSFLIVPLTFLSGVFYSIKSLPPFWAELSKYNPFLYMIDGFRYGFFGQSDQPVLLSLFIMLIATMVLTIICVAILASGYKLRDG